MTEAADLDPGQAVVDREADEADEAVVVNTPPVRADEWDLGGETVAEYAGNEAYPDDDPVVAVVFCEAFDGADLDPTDVDGQLPLGELALPYYSYPESRLRCVVAREEPESPASSAESDARGERVTVAGDTPRDALPDDLDAIAAAVAEREVDGVEVDPEAGVVRVQKLDLTYTVTRDGRVLDSGAFARALEDVAEGAVGEREGVTLAEVDK